MQFFLKMLKTNKIICCPQRLSIWSGEPVDRWLLVPGIHASPVRKSTRVDFLKIGRAPGRRGGGPLGRLGKRGAEPGRAGLGSRPGRRPRPGSPPARHRRSPPAPPSRPRPLPPTSRPSRLTRREASEPLPSQPPPPRSSPERGDKGRRRLATLRHVTATLRRRQF